ncbi:MAG: acyltransferase family protein [Vicinamibacterales bacterium]
MAASRDGAPPAVHSPQLDGLRAGAVAAVAWSHWLPEWQFGVPLGAGVHLFFVLSGFLITRILLGLRAAPDRGAAIGRFYLRRALRLFPAFYLVLGVAVWADVPLARATWPWHAGYLSNVFIAGLGEWQGHLSHFWSLAVEEQFYLVWPWLIVFVPVRWLPWLIGGTVLLGPAARLLAAWRGLGESFWALVPAGSADSLGLGAWLAWAIWQRPVSVPTLARGRVAGVALIGWLALAMLDRLAPLPAAVASGRQLLQGIVFAWIVAGAARGFTGGAGAWIGHAAIRYVGRISYGVYLIHAFAPVVVFAAARAAGVDALIPPSPAGRAALYAATTLGLAALMWRLVEQPVLRLKARVPYVAARA